MTTTYFLQKQICEIHGDQRHRQNQPNLIFQTNFQNLLHLEDRSH